MDTGILADAVVVGHFAFVLFVIAGGLLVSIAPKIAFLHLPALAWAVFVELSGTICPLTPLEIALRQQAGESGYAGGFVDHYVMPVLYPAGLTRQTQMMLGAVAFGINVIAYGWALYYRRAKRGNARARQ
jgi:hypothetical protein